MNYLEMTDKQALDFAFSANTFPSIFIDLFDVKSKSSSNENKMLEFINELKKDGFLIKKKRNSDFIYITAIKRKQNIKG